MSGLQINKSKSECLLLQFETQVSNYNDSFLEIPIVQNVKVLGHYFGKDKIVCNYQNFYSKLIKLEKILNVWRQRDLTIFGKNILITSLINSQLLFNCQIESPPHDFIRMAEKIKKQFLWSGGVPKIAHNSLVGSYKEGGIQYKDLQTQIEAINIKLVTSLRSCKSNRSLLPLQWISTYFLNQSNIEDRNKNYYHSFIKNNLDIVCNCYFKLSRKNRWPGHPYYYDRLYSIQKLLADLPEDINDILSTPIWFNKFFGTKFDCEISKAGFNYIKDIVFNGKAINLCYLSHVRLKTVKKSSLLRIG